MHSAIQVLALFALRSTDTCCADVLLASSIVLVMLFVYVMKRSCVLTKPLVVADINFRPCEKVLGCLEKCRVLFGEQVGGVTFPLKTWTVNRCPVGHYSGRLEVVG